VERDLKCVPILIAGVEHVDVMLDNHFKQRPQKIKKLHDITKVLNKLDDLINKCIRQNKDEHFVLGLSVARNLIIKEIESKKCLKKK